MNATDPAAKLSRRHTAIRIALITLYTLVFFVRAPSALPTVWRSPWELIRTALFDTIEWSLALGSAHAASHELIRGIYFAITAGVVPWCVLRFVGGLRAGDMGARIPNRLAWRVLVLGNLVALPFSWWMVQGVNIPAPALTLSWSFTAYYLIVLLVEHFFFHGVCLAMARPDARWPSPPPIATDAATSTGRACQWLGLAQPTRGAVGVRRITRWTGLPDHCAPAALLAGLLFGLAHMGKDPRELLLSFPGGVALALLAFRTNTWWTAYALHVSVGFVAMSMG